MDTLPISFAFPLRNPLPIVHISSSASASASSSTTKSQPNPNPFLPPSPTSVPVPPKRLRSCLSPSRQRTPTPDAPGGPISPISPTEGLGGGAGRNPYIAMSATSTISTDEPSLTCSSSPSPMTSRSASFSSQDHEGEYWRRSRSVRWDESGEDGGCVMAAIYSTWSADDYDRSPLEPPKPEERACLMPARGSRCLSPLDCWTEDGDDDQSHSGNNAFFPRTSAEAGSESPFLAFSECLTRTVTLRNDPALGIPSTGRYGDDEEDKGGEEEEGCSDSDAEDAETKEWEECMERRRMMFAQMCGGGRKSNMNEENQSEEDDSGDNQRRFEGYTSISANLVAMLASAGLGGAGPYGGVSDRKGDSTGAIIGGVPHYLVREAATPVGTPVEVDVQLVPAVSTPMEIGHGIGGMGMGSRPRLVRGEHRLRTCFGPEDEVVEEDEEEIEGEDEQQEEGEPGSPRAPSAETVFAALRAFRMGPGRELRSGDEGRDRN